MSSGVIFNFFLLAQIHKTSFNSSNSYFLVFITVHLLKTDSAKFLVTDVAKT
jgi:hypothetical protein